MPSELGPVEQTSHLYPLGPQLQVSFYDITRPEFSVGVMADDTLKAVWANRRRMREWLMQGIDVQFNNRLLRVEEHGDKVTAHLEDGTSATGYFLVGAEGTRSVVRRQNFLKGQDVIKPLPIGSVFGEISLSGDDFSEQLTNSHSNYIAMDPIISGDEQAAIFCALNRVSPDDKTSYHCDILLWVDKNTPKVGEKKWSESASQEQLAAFARERTNHYPYKLRSLVDKIPTEGYYTPGFQLQSVELEPEHLPPGRVLLIGDAVDGPMPMVKRLNSLHSVGKPD
ncbi:hypothetical protein BGAL_0182g00170 [Botrytis galanthina]|uniref:Cyclic nucleotide-binding domain-containing protein n=1 Tax=Botrytis galanthina TaxID=278940 RepID=A0A4S8R8W9_9HELO|nr:hypothetical protein BGAL_0182g00170 [Botrytis galanthina]